MRAALRWGDWKSGGELLGSTRYGAEAPGGTDWAPARGKSGKTGADSGKAEADWPKSGGEDRRIGDCGGGSLLLSAAASKRSIDVSSSMTAGFELVKTVALLLTRGCMETGEFVEADSSSEKRMGGFGKTTAGRGAGVEEAQLDWGGSDSPRSCGWRSGTTNDDDGTEGPSG